MSRTYRKSDATDSESKVAYINARMDRVLRTYNIERVLTQAGKLAYKLDMEKYEEDYYTWFHSGGRDYNNDFWGYYRARPVKPEIWNYKDRRYVKEDIDVEAETKRLSDKYDYYKRDARYNESPRNKTFKRLCKKSIRNQTRNMTHKVMTDEDAWENINFPITKDSKKYIWDVW